MNAEIRDEAEFASLLEIRDKPGLALGRFIF